MPRAPKDTTIANLELKLKEAREKQKAADEATIEKNTATIAKAQATIKAKTELIQALEKHNAVLRAKHQDATDDSDSGE